MYRIISLSLLISLFLTSCNLDFSDSNDKQLPPEITLSPTNNSQLYYLANIGSVYFKVKTTDVNNDLNEQTVYWGDSLLGKTKDYSFNISIPTTMITDSTLKLTIKASDQAGNLSEIRNQYHAVNLICWNKLIQSGSSDPHVIELKDKTILYSIGDTLRIYDQKGNKVNSALINNSYLPISISPLENRFAMLNGYLSVYDYNLNLCWYKILENYTNLSGSVWLDNGSLVIYGNVGSDVQIQCFSSVGELLWQQKITGNLVEERPMVVATKDNNLLITLQSNSSSNGGLDIFAYKFTPAGVLLWKKNYGCNNDDYNRTLVEDEQGGALIGCVTSSTVGSSLYKIDSNGQITWTVSVNELSYPMKAIRLSDNSFLVNKGNMYLARISSDGKEITKLTDVFIDDICSLQDGGFMLALQNWHNSLLKVSGRFYQEGKK